MQRATFGMYIAPPPAPTSPKHKRRCCVVCGSIARYKCGECRAVSYCSHECQKQHWPTHSLICDVDCEGSGVSMLERKLCATRLVLLLSHEVLDVAIRNTKTNCAPSDRGPTSYTGLATGTAVFAVWALAGATMVRSMVHRPLRQHPKLARKPEDYGLCEIRSFTFYSLFVFRITMSCRRQSCRGCRH